MSLDLNTESIQTYISRDGSFETIVAKNDAEKSIVVSNEFGALKFTPDNYEKAIDLINNHKNRELSQMGYLWLFVFMDIGQITETAKKYKV